MLIFYLCAVKATLIISVYKDVSALEAVLRSVVLQKEKDFEVIISQDCDDPCFDQLIEKFRSSFPIKHLQQPDQGFLKTKMLNKAIRASESERLIFIDGDCVLHRRFVKQYVHSIREGRMCIGRRVNLDAETSRKIRSGERTVPGYLEMIRNKSTSVEESFPLWSLLQRKLVPLLGSNMGWYKADLIKINGFDETYITPGFGEDSDIEFRARKAGIVPYSVRYKAIQYHLFHERPNRENLVKISKDLFNERKQRTDYRCQFGLETLEA
jgi:glycosyltransferase involved in cell wall biosynthesis